MIKEIITGFLILVTVNMLFYIVTIQKLENKIKEQEIITEFLEKSLSNESYYTDSLEKALINITWEQKKQQ
jgi:high-affinity Fe2+/Pb2+ permease|tara:strand:- start:59 stop:271 length:213 start_codon:yes stop_codon:yes gene_type:complete